MINKFRLDGDLAIILLVSLYIKTAIIVFFPALYHADENFQYFEAAHRIAFGYGVAPWEFRDGIRSLVVPGFMAGIFKAVSAYSDKPEIYIAAARFTLACFSLISIACLYRYARTISRVHAVIAASVLGVWCEAIFFSVRPMTEGLAANALVCAIALGLTGTKSGSKSDIVLSAFFATLAVMFRFHIGPGVAVLALWVCRADIRRWLLYISGALPPLALFGAVDWLTWGAPFSSFIKYFQINIVEGKASHFGTKPFTWYFSEIYSHWSFCLPVFLFLIAFKLKDKLPWLLTGCVIVLSHSAIAHKEYRFIFPGLLCVLIAAALGSADLIRSIASGRAKARLAAFTIVLWSTASVGLAYTPAYFKMWERSRELIEASYFLHEQTDMCGLFLYDTGWWDSGGYSHLHRNVPIYDNAETEFDYDDGAPLANYALAAESAAGDLEDYQIIKCFERKPGHALCVFKRPGVCAKSGGKIKPLSALANIGEE